jgi:LysM repeat protein
MHRYFKIVILTLGTLIFSLTWLNAQFKPTPVEKSNQKIIYMGRMFYVHMVKEGQTLFSICKVYQVSEEDVRKANSHANLDPLTVGLTIRIPVSEEEASNVQTQQSPEIKASDDFIYHTVLPKETAYFLHSKYNVPLDAIYYYNPGTENGLQIGQVVRIPRQGMVAKVNTEIQVQQENVIRYEVKPGDTLYRIALNYGVTVSAIINANQELRWGLKAGQIILIPTEEASLYLVSKRMQDSILLVTALQGYSSWQCDSIRMQKRMRPPTKVALLLPFFAREGLRPDTALIQVDSITGEVMKNRPKPLRGRGAAEFYEGFLLAVDSLKNTGHNISLFVYDTEGDTNRMNIIFGDLDIVEPDLIIGPFYAANVRKASKYAFEHKIPFIPPLMKGDTLIKNNPYLFQVYPSVETELIQQVKYLSRIPQSNMLFLYKPSLKNEQNIRKFRQLLLNYLTLQTGSDTLPFTNLVINDSLDLKLSHVLKKDTLNYAIVYSSYEPDVINALSRLHFYLRDYPIKVFGQPSWQIFANVKIDHFHDLDATIYSPFFIDYTSPHVKDFVRKCRQKLNYEPYRTTSAGNGLNYTYLGYDLGLYFITTSFYYGKDLCNCISNYTPSLLLTNYYFIRNSATGCFENNYINFIRYTRDFEVVGEYLEAHQN